VRGDLGFVGTFAIIAGIIAPPRKAAADAESLSRMLNTTPVKAGL